MKANKTFILAMPILSIMFLASCKSGNLTTDTEIQEPVAVTDAEPTNQISTSTTQTIIESSSATLEPSDEPPPDATNKASSSTLDQPKIPKTPSEPKRLPSTGQIDSDWVKATNTNNMENVRDWYLANTGYQAYFDPDLGRHLTESDLEPIDGLDITEDNTVIEGKYIRGRIRILADNVTIRGSVIDVNGAYVYGLEALNSYAGEAGNDWTVEYVTFTNSEYNRTGSHEDRGNKVMGATTSGTARFNQALDGYGSGFRSLSGSHDQLWEYNFIDHIVRSPGSHNTGFNLRSDPGKVPNRDITFYRNLVTDGTSGAMNFYPRAEGTYRNLLWKENIIDLYYPGDSSTNYCAQKGSSKLPWQPDNVRWIGNIFGQTTSQECGTSNHSSGSSGNEFAGNRYINGTPIE